MMKLAILCSVLMISTVYGGWGVRPASSFDTRSCLTKHNYYRAMHGAPPLTMDQGLNRAAENWANRLANSGRFEHSRTRGVGENLYMMGGSGGFGDICAKAVDSWYNEVRHYNFNRPGFSMKTGHFTQVVWKNSKKLGIGIRQKGYRVYVVAQYTPAGNSGSSSQYRANVTPARRG